MVDLDAFSSPSSWKMGSLSMLEREGRRVRLAKLTLGLVCLARLAGEEEFLVFFDIDLIIVYHRCRHYAR